MKKSKNTCVLNWRVDARVRFQLTKFTCLAICSPKTRTMCFR